ncbi:MAG: pilus assembly protein [Clostridia bacterium]|nr:pilus assembly protein [Clostridia bacterium]
MYCLKRKKQGGQSVVETALVLPIIIVILMGIIDFGLLFNNYLIMSNASREAARSAAVGLTDVQIRVVVTNLTVSLQQTKLRTTIYPSESIRKKGDEVSVTIEYENMLLTPIIGSIIPNPVHLKSKTVMRME